MSESRFFAGHRTPKTSDSSTPPQGMVWCPECLIGGSLVACTHTLIDKVANGERHKVMCNRHQGRHPTILIKTRQ